MNQSLSARAAAQELSDAEMRSLRAYAVGGIPVKQDARMFERLRLRRLVVGAISYDKRGDPFGVIVLTDLGRHALGLPAGNAPSAMSCLT